MFNLSYVFHFSSCGYFCLKHVVKDLKIKRKGYMSLFDLKEVLISNNYYCCCYKVKTLNNVKDKCFSLIKVKNNFHYVVVEKFNENYVWVYDPLFLFVRKIKREKFVSKWSKICLFYRKI